MHVATGWNVLQIFNVTLLSHTQLYLFALQNSSLDQLESALQILNFGFIHCNAVDIMPSPVTIFSRLGLGSIAILLFIVVFIGDCYIRGINCSIRVS